MRRIGFIKLSRSFWILQLAKSNRAHHARIRARITANVHVKEFYNFTRTFCDSYFGNAFNSDRLILVLLLWIFLKEHDTYIIHTHTHTHTHTNFSGRIWALRCNYESICELKLLFWKYYLSLKAIYVTS